jgi:hypothetical protein
VQHVERGRAAVPALRYQVPLLGVVRPGASAAALSTRNRKVGVIATQATVRSRAYFQAINEEDPFIEVLEHATPDLVPLVEAGRLEGGLVEDVVRSSIGPLLEKAPDIDTLLLAAPITRSWARSSVRLGRDGSHRLRFCHGERARRPARDPRPTGANRCSGEARPADHRDVDKFTVIADRLFDSYFHNVERVAVAGAV